MNISKSTSDIGDEYIEGLVQNDPQIIDTIYTKIRNPVCKYVTNKGLTHEDAEDIIQDTFIIILGKINNQSIRLTSSFFSYFLGICKNVMLKKSMKF